MAQIPIPHKILDMVGEPEDDTASTFVLLRPGGVGGKPQFPPTDKRLNVDFPKEDR